MDIFGDDYNAVRKLLMVYPLASPVIVSDGEYEWEYYREFDICRIIDILTTLAKTNFVNVLRPQYQFIKDDEPVYTSEDLKNLLGIKDELLRKFRNEGYLGYTKYSGSDKIWYTQKNVQDFLNNPVAVHKPWKE